MSNGFIKKQAEEFLGTKADYSAQPGISSLRAEAVSKEASSAGNYQVQAGEWEGEEEKSKSSFFSFRTAANAARQLFELTKSVFLAPVHGYSQLYHFIFPKGKRDPKLSDVKYLAKHPGAVKETAVEFAADLYDHTINRYIEGTIDLHQEPLTPLIDFLSIMSIGSLSSSAALRLAGRTAKVASKVSSGEAAARLSALSDKAYALSDKAMAVSALPERAMYSAARAAGRATLGRLIDTDAIREIKKEIALTNGNIASRMGEFERDVLSKIKALDEGDRVSLDSAIRRPWELVNKDTGKVVIPERIRQAYDAYADYIKRREDEIISRGLKTQEELRGRVYRQMANDIYGTPRVGQMEFEAIKAIYDSLDVKPLYAPVIVEPVSGILKRLIKGEVTVNDVFGFDAYAGVAKGGYNVKFLLPYKGGKGVEDPAIWAARTGKDFINFTEEADMISRISKNKKLADLLTSKVGSAAGMERLSSIFAKGSPYDNFIANDRLKVGVFISRIAGENVAEAAMKALGDASELAKTLKDLRNHHIYLKSPTTAWYLKWTFSRLRPGTAAYTILKMYDKIHGIFKTFYTILSPSWYLMNVVGNSILTAMSAPWRLGIGRFMKENAALKYPYGIELPRVILGADSSGVGVIAKAEEVLSKVNSTLDPAFKKYAIVAELFKNRPALERFARSVDPAVSGASSIVKRVLEAPGVVQEIYRNVDNAASIVVKNIGQYKSLVREIERVSVTSKKSIVQRLLKKDALTKDGLELVKREFPEFSRELDDIGRAISAGDYKAVSQFVMWAYEREVTLRSMLSSAVDSQASAIRSAVSAAGGLKVALSLSDEAAAVARKVGVALGDYLRMGPIERAVMRRAYSFFGWLRSMLEFTFTYPFIHPTRSLFFGRIASIYSEAMNDEWFSDEVPDYAKGVVPLWVSHDGSDPIIVGVKKNPLIPFASTGIEFFGDLPFIRGLNPLRGNILISLALRVTGMSPEFRRVHLPPGSPLVALWDGSVAQFNESSGLIETRVPSGKSIIALLDAIPITQFLRQLASDYDITLPPVRNIDGTPRYPMTPLRAILGFTGIKVVDVNVREAIERERRFIRSLIFQKLKDIRTAEEREQFDEILRAYLSGDKYRKVGRF